MQNLGVSLFISQSTPSQREQCILCLQSDSTSLLITHVLVSTPVEHGCSAFSLNLPSCHLAKYNKGGLHLPTLTVKQISKAAIQHYLPACKESPFLRNLVPFPGLLSTQEFLQRKPSILQESMCHKTGQVLHEASLYLGKIRAG